MIFFNYRKSNRIEQNYINRAFYSPPIFPGLHTLPAACAKILGWKPANHSATQRGHSMKNKEAKKIARNILGYCVTQAWNDLDNCYYKRLIPADRELIKLYIHRYGCIIGLLLRRRYRPN